MLYSLISINSLLFYVLNKFEEVLLFDIRYVFAVK